MAKIPIFKLPVANLDGWTHCWVPIVDGTPLQHTYQDGTTEPLRSVRGAKRAVAKHLGVDEKELEFDVHRGEQ